MKEQYMSDFNYIKVTNIVPLEILTQSTVFY